MKRTIFLSLISIVIGSLSCGLPVVKKAISTKVTDSIVEIESKDSKYIINFNDSGYISSIKQYKEEELYGAQIDFYQNGSFEHVDHVYNGKFFGDAISFYPFPISKIMEWHDVQYEDTIRFDNEFRTYWDDGALNYKKSHFLDLRVYRTQSKVYIKITGFSSFEKSKLKFVNNQYDANYNPIPKDIVDTIPVNIGDSILIADKITPGEHIVYLNFISQSLDPKNDSYVVIRKKVLYRIKE